MNFETQDESGREEVRSFFQTQTQNHLKVIQQALLEQDVLAADEVCEQMDRLFTCLGCEVMIRFTGQLRSHVRHHDWVAAQETIDAMYGYIWRQI